MFPQFTIVTNRQTDRQTDKPRYIIEYAASMLCSALRAT